MQYYSNSQKPYCEICKIDDIDVLTIDHINNNGSEHRKTMKGHDFYYELIKTDFPNGYQVLCRNCIYENNSVLQKEYSRLINNTHERREFVGLWLILGVGMLFAHIGVRSLLALHVNYVSIIMLFSGISLLIAMIYILTLHFLTNKNPLNEYVNFEIQKLEAFSNASIKVI